jgi:hypothetical protein
MADTNRPSVQEDCRMTVHYLTPRPRPRKRRLRKNATGYETLEWLLEQHPGRDEATMDHVAETCWAM